MYSRTHFTELLSLIPRTVFSKIVKTYDSDKYSKGFTTWNHLVAMIFSQLSKAQSLRELEACFNAVSNTHYHLGVKKVKRSTLGEANQKRDAKVFEALVSHMISEVHHQETQDVKELLYLLDSSPILLSTKQHPWVDKIHHRHKGLKVHLLYCPQTRTPSQLRITDYDMNDINIGRNINLEPEAVYVFDKGYTDYNWWYKIHQKQSVFVTRFKKNAALRKTQDIPIDKDQKDTILSDQIVRFKNKNPRGNKINLYQEPLRRITVSRPDKETPLILATNDLKRPASQIAALYKKRWDIELFFKWIKQNLKIKKFIGTSQNAVKIQIYTAIITYILALKLKKLKLSKKPLYLFVEELYTLLFMPVQIKINDQPKINNKYKNQQMLFP